MSSVAMESSWMGTFSPVAFAQVLKRVADEERSGELQIVSGNWVKSIHVDGGAVRFAKSNMRQDRLGESMLAHECISQNDYRLASERMANDGCRFGEALLKLGRLDRKQLHRELAVQIQRIVLSLFRVSEGLYSFEETSSNETRLPFSLSVPPLLLKGLRSIEDGRLILSALPPADTKVRIAVKPAYRFDLSKVAAVERNVLERAGEGTSIGDIVRDPAFDRSDALRSCFALLSVGLLEVVPAVEESNQGDDDEVRELILSQFARIESSSDADLLGVDPRAGEDVLQESYETLCGEWADVREQTEDASLREKIDAIEFRLAAAYHQLLVDRERQTLAEATPRLSDVENSARRSRVEQLERDAKLHIQVRDWNGAVSLLHELVVLAPANASYQLMLGHALQNHPTQSKTAEEHFLQAVELDPESVQAHLALGRHYQRLKKHARAITELERALAIDPDNEEAKRLLTYGREPTGMKKLFNKIFH